MFDKGKQILTTTSAIALCLCGCTFTYNTCLIPLHALVFAPATDIATLCGIVVFITIAFITYRKPQIVKRGICCVVALCCYFLSVLGYCVYVITFIPALFVIFAVFFYIAIEFFCLFTMLSCCAIDHKRLIFCITLGVILAYGGSFLVLGLPQTLQIIVAIILPVLCMPFAYHQSIVAFDTITSREPTAISKIASPKSFLPFSHTLFLFLFLLQASFGYSVYVTEGSLASPWGMLFPVCIMVLSIIRRGNVSADITFRSVLFIVIAGLLSVAFAASLPVSVSKELLSLANCGYLIFSWFVLCRVASQNKAASLVVFAWGSCMSEFGIIIGANLANFARAIAQVELISFVVVLVLVACILLLTHRFDIDIAIDSIVPPTTDTSNIVNTSEEILDHACSYITGHYGLTPREHEIVALLARGRNGVRIQETLVISRNTYKTHIRHIYEKLSVHDQQEVIDLVEHYCLSTSKSF